MTDNPKRSILALLTSHWICMLGVALVTTAGFSWLFALPIQLRGHANNPYIGIVVFILIPVIFVLGLVLIALGLCLARRRIQQGLATAPDRRTYFRKLAVFFAGTTAINIVIGTQGTYRAVQHMETAQFCGQSCHVMKPEFTAHQDSPHARVECVGCHVAPGAAGWVAAKMAGTRQLMDVVFNRAEHPIESAIESNRLVPASETCEQCHWPQMFHAVKFRVISHYGDDSANTKTQTVLMMRTGGGNLGRNAVVRKFGVADLTTTVLTLTIAGLAADSALAGDSNPRWRRRCAAIVSMLAGAAAGAALLRFSLPVPLSVCGAMAMLCAFARFENTHA